MEGKVRLASGQLVAPDHMLVGIPKIAEAWAWKEADFKAVVTAAHKRPKPKNTWILRLPKIRKHGRLVYALRADEAMRWYWMFVVWAKARPWQGRDRQGRISRTSPLASRSRWEVPRFADNFAQERFAEMQAKILALAGHAGDYDFGEAKPVRGTLSLRKRIGRNRRTIKD